MTFSALPDAIPGAAPSLLSGFFIHFAEGSAMRVFPGLSSMTLGVRSVEHAAAFYEKLGWKRSDHSSRAVAVFALRSFLVPRLGPRLFACVCKCARVYVCVRLCVRVPARACVCACVCVHDRVWVCVNRCF